MRLTRHLPLHPLRLKNINLGSFKFLRTLLIILGIGALILLGTYRQPTYQKTWLDEGMALQGAINLVEHGQYAMRSSEGFRVLDQPLIANGPGLILPVSAIFYLFGVGLMQARILMAVYLVLAVVLFFFVASIYYKKLEALISLFVFLAIPAEGVIHYGRQALGNVPALVYFLTGVLFFHRMAVRKSIFDAILSGLFLGLALVTKGQYWIVLPILGMVFMADLFYYKQVGYKIGITIILTTVGVLLLWQCIQYLLVGAENYSQHLASISSSARVTVFAFRPQKIPGNIWYLVKSGFPVFILPGLIVALLNARRRSAFGLEQFFLAVFVVAWLIWYVFVSVGWSRYAFEAYTVGAIVSGGAFMQIIDFVRAPSRGQRLFLATVLRNVSGVFLGIAFLWSTWAFGTQLVTIMVYSDTGPLKLSQYIKENIPSTVLIESWEWELDTLTPEFTYHHPTNDWVDKKTAETQFGERPDDVYEPLAWEPEYLIDGPFSKLTGIYAETISAGCCIRIVEIGEYTLYRVKTDRQ